MSFIRLSKTFAVVSLFLALIFSAFTHANEPPVQPIDINHADVEVLTQLKNIGVKKAKAIVAYREERGSFKSVEELIEVKGIGEETLEQNRSHLIASQ